MRIRTIKPEFFTHEGLFELEKETKLPIRVAFAGLWCVADKAGRFKWEPRRIGVSVLPYDGIDFSRVLDALFTRGYVLRYRVEGVEYGAIPSFSKHQFLNNKEKDSTIPEPSSAQELDATATREPRVEDANGSRAIGKEGEGDRERKDVVASSPLASLDGFLYEWKSFIDHRKKIKKPLNERAIELTIASLGERPDSAIEALQMCMVKGWQSIEWGWFDRVKSENAAAKRAVSHSQPPGPARAYDAPRGNL